MYLIIFHFIYATPPQATVTAITTWKRELIVLHNHNTTRKKHLASSAEAIEAVYNLVTTYIHPIYITTSYTHSSIQMIIINTST